MCTFWSSWNLFYIRFFLICSMSFKMTSPHGFRRMGNWRWFPERPEAECCRTLMREVWDQSHTAYLTNQLFTKNSNCGKKRWLQKLTDPCTNDSNHWPLPYTKPFVNRPWTGQAEERGAAASRWSTACSSGWGAHPTASWWGWTSAYRNAKPRFEPKVWSSCGAGASETLWAYCCCCSAWQFKPTGCSCNTSGGDSLQFPRCINTSGWQGQGPHSIRVDQSWEGSRGRDSGRVPLTNMSSK